MDLNIEYSLLLCFQILKKDGRSGKLLDGREKIERIDLTCDNPNSHKKEFVDFFLNLYNNIYKNSRVPIEKYIE